MTKFSQYPGVRLRLIMGQGQIVVVQVRRNHVAQLSSRNPGLRVVCLVLLTKLVRNLQ